MESHGEVDTPYRLDRDIGFDPAGATESTTCDFAAERLAAGADMLAVLWWSAWFGERDIAEAPDSVAAASP
jgi:hypothetical protein